MATRTRVPDRPTSTSRELPPLENGDRLTRVEFERRYDAMPHLQKAELIEGVVYVPSPVRCPWHGDQQAAFVTWLGVYAASTSGVRTADNSTMRLDLDNEPQPDVALRILEEFGGQSHIDEEGYLAGGPELVAEVASSSASYDLGPKLHVYRRNGVREYVVWRVLDEEIDWFVLREGRYDPLPPDKHGIFRSEVFPGLALDRPAMLRLDLAAVLATLGTGLASPEHAEFVERLGEQRETRKR